jgi:hypothetical protein
MEVGKCLARGALIFCNGMFKEHMEIDSQMCIFYVGNLWEWTRVSLGLILFLLGTSVPIGGGPKIRSGFRDSGD